MKAAPLGVVAALAVASSVGHAYVLRAPGWNAPELVLHVDPSVARLAPNMDGILQQVSAQWARTAAPQVVFEMSQEDLPRDGTSHHNVVTAYKEGWPFDSRFLAVTVTDRDPLDHTLVSASIFINATVHHDRECGVGRYDLQSTLTHEVGHALGLGDEPEIPSAVMHGTQYCREVLKRMVSRDEVNAMEALYPENGSAGCESARRGGNMMASMVIWVLVAWVHGRPRRRGHTTRP